MKRLQPTYIFNKFTRPVSLSFCLLGDLVLSSFVGLSEQDI